MADIEVKRTHGLGLPAARKSAEKMADHLGMRFDLKGRWEGDTLVFQRPGVSGTLAITDRELHLAVTLGFLLKAMRGSIERAVHDELDSLFASRKSEPPETKSTQKKPSPKAKKAPAAKKKGG
jgi:putative polyhydroxyalkanoate system protein